MKKTRKLNKAHMYRITLTQDAVLFMRDRVEKLFSKGQKFLGQYELNTKNNAVCFFTYESEDKKWDSEYVYFPIDAIRVTKVSWEDVF